MIKKWVFPEWCHNRDKELRTWFNGAANSIRASDVIDLFYQTMYYNLLKVIMSPGEGPIVPHKLPPRWLLDVDAVANKSDALTPWPMHAPRR